MNEIIPQEIKLELLTESNNILEKVKTIAIKTEKDTNLATSFLSLIKKMRIKIEEKVNPSVKRAKEAYDEIRKLRDEMILPLKTAESEIRHKLDAFVTSENDKRAELQRKADEKFQKAVEKAESTGKKLKIIPQVVQMVKGTINASFSVAWYAEVIDKMALIKAVAEGKLDISAIDVNMPFFNNLAKTIKEERVIAPGVIAKKKTITRV